MRQHKSSTRKAIAEAGPSITLRFRNLQTGFQGTIYHHIFILNLMRFTDNPPKNVVVEMQSRVQIKIIKINKCATFNCFIRRHFILHSKTKPLDSDVPCCCLPISVWYAHMYHFPGLQPFCFPCRQFVCWSRMLDFTLILFGSIRSLTGPYFLRDPWPWKYHIAPGFPCMKGEINPLSCSVQLFLEC